MSVPAIKSGGALRPHSDETRVRTSAPDPAVPGPGQTPPQSSDSSASPSPQSSASPPVTPPDDDAPASPLHRRLLHALTRIHSIPARHIQSPPTQPRRASVAVLIRIKPAKEDEEWLSEEYDTDGLPIKGGRIDRFLSSPLQQSAGTEPAASAAALSASQDSYLHASQPNISASQSQLAGSQFTQLDASADQLRSSANTLPSTSAASASTSGASAPLALSRFFSLSWVKRGRPEVLYIKRATRQGDKWSAHVAFPGGRREEDDENGLYTAMRETWEEVGIDLAEREFLSVGKLDDREITTSLGKRLLMVLSPYIFLQMSPFSPLPDLQPSEVASAHWIPLSLLYTPTPRWGLTSVDIAQRLAPKSAAVRWALRALVGKMDFRCILLPNEPVAVAEGEEEEEAALAEARRRLQDEQGHAAAAAKMEAGAVGTGQAMLESMERPQLRLWGLTLGMTLDLMAQMSTMPSSGAVSSHTAFTPEGLPVTSPSPSHGSGRQNTSEISALLSQPGASSGAVPGNAGGGSAASAASAWLATLASRVLDAGGVKINAPPPPASSQAAHELAPSMTSVFPTFSYPDVNFWIWVFSWRYRAVVRNWERSLGSGLERSVDWSGLALGAFYSAVRRALVVAILMRALGFLSFAGASTWLAARRISRHRRGLPGLGLDEVFPALRD